MTDLLLALLLSLALTLAALPIVLPFLRKMKFGQTIYELAPERHKAKQGTPTMGGLVFAAVSSVMTLVVAIVSGTLQQGFWSFGVGLVLVSVLCMGIGFADDYIKVVKKRNLGLIWWQKLIGQFAVGLLFSLYCYFNPDVGSGILLPFSGRVWDLGWLYIPVMCCVFVFMVNSSNLQDGLDGLLTSTSMIGSGTLGIMALIPCLAGTCGAAMASQYRSLCIFAFALVGALVGFLRYNYYPAQIFMGDTGSMFIGGAIMGMVFLMRIPLAGLLLCITWLASSVSVILQRIYFKLTHGKRIFKMSPIHHHFELCGMSECQIVAMYSAVELIACLTALLITF